MSGSQTVAVSQEQIDFVSCVEQLFWETGLVPTNEKIAELTGISLPSIKKYWELEHLRSALTKRGVDLTVRRNNLLTLPQLTLANMLLNPHDNKSTREKLKEANVTSQQYQAWLRDPAFTDYLGMRAKQVFEVSDFEAYKALSDAVRGGDLKAIQLFFEMRGIYNPKAANEVPIEIILVKVIEVLARHVRDPQILQAIAADLELVDIGTVGSPRGMPVLDVVSELVTPSNEFTL